MKNKTYIVPNACMPGKIVNIDTVLCDGCNICVDRCRTQVLLPNPQKGKPPIVVYPDECWFCACCEEYCPKGAIHMEYPGNQRIGWKRKESGEYFRIGMANPPTPNKRPPYGYGNGK